MASTKMPAHHSSTLTPCHQAWKGRGAMDFTISSMILSLAGMWNDRVTHTWSLHHPVHNSGTASTPWYHVSPLNGGYKGSVPLQHMVTIGYHLSLPAFTSLKITITIWTSYTIHTHTNAVSKFSLLKKTSMTKERKWALQWSPAIVKGDHIPGNLLLLLQVPREQFYSSSRGSNREEEARASLW